MKVRVAYTIDADDNYRRAIRHHYGLSGLATRAEVRRWAEAFGDSEDDNLMDQLEQDDASKDS